MAVAYHAASMQRAVITQSSESRGELSVALELSYSTSRRERVDRLVGGKVVLQLIARVKKLLTKYCSPRGIATAIVYKATHPVPAGG